RIPCDVHTPQLRNTTNTPHTHTHTHTHTQTETHAETHRQRLAHTHTHTHTQTHTHRDTHTHTQRHTHRYTHGGREHQVMTSCIPEVFQSPPGSTCWLSRHHRPRQVSSCLGGQRYWG